MALSEGKMDRRLGNLRQYGMQNCIQRRHENSTYTPLSSEVSPGHRPPPTLKPIYQPQISFVPVTPTFTPVPFSRAPATMTRFALVVVVGAFLLAVGSCLPMYEAMPMHPRAERAPVDETMPYPAWMSRYSGPYSGTYKCGAACRDARDCNIPGSACRSCRGIVSDDRRSQYSCR